jgi:uncharacterized protein
VARLDVNRVLRIVIALASLGIAAGLATAWWQQSKIQQFTLAAGASSGESYILGDALRKVVERHYPKIRISLVETGGTVENLQMLEDGRAQLATAQADVPPGPEARILGILYDDTLQLLVPKNSSIQNFAQLSGKRVALSRNGGQFQSFLRVAEHFGLREADFRFVGASDQAADDAFLNGQADAVFRVRTLGDPSIRRLVQAGKIHFLPIEHAAAMKIKNSSFEPALIPEGAYWGTPPVPSQDLPTLAIHRTLLASAAANPVAIRAITEVLIERRQEIMQEVPAELTEVRLLLAQVRRPDPHAGLGPALHIGAASFYDKDKPSFLLAHADYVGLILTVVLMVSSWIWELRRWMQSQQKNTAHKYSDRIVRLMNAAQDTNSLASLEDIWRNSLAILTEAVHDLGEDKLSEESFNSCRSILQIALEVIANRRAALTSVSSAASPIGSPVSVLPLSVVRSAPGTAQVPD